MSAKQLPVEQAFDRYLTRPMFCAAFFFLVVVAAFTHRIKESAELISVWELLFFICSFGLLWPIFIIEALVRLVLHRDGPLWRKIVHSLFLMVIPPLHLGTRGYARTKEIWLPFLGWRVVDKKLRQRLEKIFSVPMVVLALLTLPLLGAEYMWSEDVKTNPGLALALDISTSVIWLGFALEFIMMVSVAENKVVYCFRHWLDLAIVLLPIIEALPAIRSLRAARLMRLEQVTRLSRAYRLKALMMKLWRALLLLEVIQRITGWSPVKRLARLRALHTAKEEELAELRTEIEELEKKVAVKADQVASEIEPAA